MSDYFSRYPLILYNNTVATNLLVRARLREKIRKLFSSYYLFYVIPEGLRGDNVAYDYYNQSRKDWLVYLSNDYIHPLCEWYKTDLALNNHIASKYGSLENARTKIAAYRTNWKSDGRKITTTEYDGLTSGQKKYWTRAFNAEQDDETYWKMEEEKRNYSTFSRYERAQDNLFAETNKIIKLELTTSVTSDVVVGDIIERYSAGTLVAKGEISAIGSNFVIIKHITETGTGFNAGNIVTIKNKNLTFTVQTRTVLASPIPDDELTYWEPLSFYDYEEELNQSRQLVTVLDSRYLLQVDRDVDRIFKSIKSYE